MATSISWADETWNPVVGCTPVSPGCAHCYAATMARRLNRWGMPQYQGLTREAGGWSGVVRTLPAALAVPYRWQRPRVVFVGSMSDLFHCDVPDAWLNRVWDVMLDTSHVYLVLTKRAHRMRGYLEARALRDDAAPPNIWAGVSIESAAELDRLDALAPALPVAGRFLSLEPLLGPLADPLDHALEARRRDGGGAPPIDWVIVGGESGAGARPMAPEWARDIRDLCARRGIPYHFKNWGPRGLGNLLDGRAWDACPPRLEAAELWIEPPPKLRDVCRTCRTAPATHHHRCRGCLARHLAAMEAAV